MTLIGYPSRTSVHPGQSLGFHLGLDAGSIPFTAAVTVENVVDRSIAQRLAARIERQPEPPEAWTGFGWPATVSLRIPADWPSGLYRVTCEVSGVKKNVASFVVRPPRGEATSKTLIHISYLTPAAYNSAGGKSFYKPRVESSADPRARKVSLDRPSYLPRLAHDDSPDRFINEAKLLTWLKGQGMSADCCSSIDLHSEPGLLDEYDCLVLAFHDEYWTKAMRDHCEAFIRRGGNLVSLSGNTCYRQVRLEDDDRTVVFYKYADLDPMRSGNLDEVTVAWAEPPVNRPQNSMLGVGFTHGAFSLRPEDHRSYRIRFPDHWVFDGVSDDQTSRFLHYETDAAGFAEEPEGYPRVTGDERTPLNLTVLASADLRDWQSKPGRATMTIHSRNGTVFNASSTNWINALDADPVVTQVTKNVLGRLSRRQEWNWEYVGHAQDATAMAATEGRLYLSTSENDLWRRFPIGADVPWTKVGHANNVVAMTAAGGTLFCATSDNHLWARTAGDFDADWHVIGRGPSRGVLGLAAAGGMLWAVDADGRLVRRPANRETVEFSDRQPFQLGTEIVSMTSYSDILFAATSDNRLLRSDRDFIAESHGWTDILHCDFAIGIAVVEWMLYVVTSENALWRLDLSGLVQP